MQVFLYDENFYFLRPKILDDPASPMPKNSTTVKPPDGLWRPQFDKVDNVWYESADQEYKDNQKNKYPDELEPNPIMEQLATLGQQLADEKLARKQAEQAQNALGVQLTAEVLARKEAEALNQSLGEQMAVLKLDVLSLKGGMTSES
ncbi:XkdW family protein [Bacillus subtilis]|uniref:XkdW family protein n=1 Tax=Bacillus subtilis TaxID=1423 RepID=UPI00034606A2|nr:XkdW family protein [Bacillus subtilis]WHY08255.1 XkdW family protein [Bacillus subtilis]